MSVSTECVVNTADYQCSHLFWITQTDTDTDVSLCLHDHAHFLVVSSSSISSVSISNSRCSLIIRWTTYYYSEQNRTQSCCCLKLTAGRTHTDLNYYRLLWTVFCFTSPRDSALLSGQCSIFSLFYALQTTIDCLSVHTASSASEARIFLQLDRQKVLSCL